jgi:DNA-binding PadR family transcriptional regulator
MNDLLILATLLPGPKHGYRLKREAGLILGQGTLHNNLIYPLLRRFVSEGLVTQKSVEGERGQTRKMYALTPLGRRTLIERLSEYSEEDAEAPGPFLLRVGLFEALAPEVREQILETRAKALRARDEHLAALQDAMELGLYGGDIVRHLRQSIQADLSWIDHLRRIQKKAQKGKQS